MRSVDGLAGLQAPHDRDKRRIARDRRLAAVHEAGHFVVAERVGMRIHGAYIAFSGTANVPTEMSFIGQYLYHRHELGRLSQRRRAMIAVAGSAAELLWVCGRFRDSLSGESVLLDSSMSEADWRLAGTDSSGGWSAKLERAAGDVLELLADKMWTPLLVAAHSLVRRREIIGPRPRHRVSAAEYEELQVQLRVARSQAHWPGW